MMWMGCTTHEQEVSIVHWCIQYGRGIKRSCSAVFNESNGRKPWKSNYWECWRPELTFQGPFRTLSLCIFSCWDVIRRAIRGLLYSIFFAARKQIHIVLKEVFVWQTTVIPLLVGGTLANWNQRTRPFLCIFVRTSFSPFPKFQRWLNETINWSMRGTIIDL